MFKIYCLNPIAQVGLNYFGEDYQLVDTLEEADAVLVRSANMHDLALPPSVKAIARAGAGVNNIPLEACAEKGIVVFNTPGANANGVKELVIAGLMLASRDVIGGVEWVAANQENPDLANLVEKKKAQFAGFEILGKKLGVIGLGAIGVLVANAAAKLGMEVYGYDPFISVNSAWQLSKHIHQSKSLEEIYRECDFITLHMPLNGNTKGILNHQAFSNMKDGVRILNFARDTLVKEEELLQAMAQGKVSRYVTDFPNPTVAGKPGVISIPHLGASTSESEDNCAIMAVHQIIEYLEQGNIKNAVNYPDCDNGTGKDAGRITINHQNIPNMIGQFTALLAQERLNIADMINKSRDQWAYTIIDMESPLPQEIQQRLSEIEGVRKVRFIK